MRPDIIDTAMAKRLVEAAEIDDAAIIGLPGGWAVMLTLGGQEMSLSAQRTGKRRIWRSLDRCVEYLKHELRITRFKLLDATNHSDTGLADGKSRADASARLRNAHQAAGHDKWFRDQVQQAIAEADAPNADWVSNEDASASWEQKRAELARSAEASAV